VFGGFTEGDFDAYVEHKWRSNAFSLERLGVKEKLIGLGREVASAMLATDGTALGCEPSSEHPALWNQKRVDAQHLFFSRCREERAELDRIIERSRSLASLIQDPSPQRSHVVLSVSIDAGHVLIAMRLHADATVDRHNLEAKTSDDARAEQLVGLLHALPKQFFAAIDDGTRTDAHALEAATLGTLLAELARPLAEDRPRRLTVGREYSRAEVLALGADMAVQARQARTALLPIFHHDAWTRENDYIGLGRRLHDEADAKRQRGLAANVRVRITAGVFSGRLGVIQEIDAKGTVKVLVGSMPIVLTAEEVEKA